MRISIPHIPPDILAASASNPPLLSTLTVAAQRVADFLESGNVAVLTGAGVSVDSGIRAYRGKDGRYMNPNYKCYSDLVEDSPRGFSFRQRYWCRSYLGYPPIAKARPNPTHYALSAFMHSGHISRLVTQNVDGLHHKARPSYWTDKYAASKILELHGTLHTVHCRKGHLTRRDLFQNKLSIANPRWKAFMDEVEDSGQRLRTNPDGDVKLENASWDDFVIPNCEECSKEGKPDLVLKPSVIFFGESVPAIVKDRSFEHVEACDRLLIIGTTTATYSAFRLLKHAIELRKPVMLLNVGPTRADSLIGKGVEKVEWHSGEVLHTAARAMLGPRISEDRELQRLLTSGIVTPIDGTFDDHAPRAGS
ncbi:DHS-like NAD/FAD-binding domain-containing protein [Sistotremastrum niveocremeum HHB9708]|uniref:DHS-like NAD/FAD-binding domain-containing protein n=1 Tax=Sistotremastrum niveocremeum HHB9708 TaxID=1314777 RepID=A0A164W7L8_9AGAM|nr:DHS-like NAD/FAD-binding domain-containing protein [Sistotremastrum niveocremeum HHB9708]